MYPQLRQRSYATEDTTSLISFPTRPCKTVAVAIHVRERTAQAGRLLRNAYVDQRFFFFAEGLPVRLKEHRVTGSGVKPHYVHHYPICDRHIALRRGDPAGNGKTFFFASVRPCLRRSLRDLARKHLSFKPLFPRHGPVPLPTELNGAGARAANLH